MLDEILHCALHAVKDSVPGIPILFISYMLMELLERSRRLDERTLHSRSRRSGPAIGGILGVVPQCGISGAAATLFSTGSISLGTMLAVFFATSDEMLPILLSSAGSQISGRVIMAIVAGKAALGIALGYLADFCFGRFFAGDKDIHSFCEKEHCECEEEESVWRLALHHTVKIALMLIGVSFALNLLMSFVGVERLSGSVFSRPIVGEALLALIGLIPNCSISVIITEGYLSGIIGLGGLFAGLLSNAGIGLLVLFRTNQSLRENLLVVLLLAVLGAAGGMLIGLFI